MKRKLFSILSITLITLLLAACKSSKKCGCPTFGMNQQNLNESCQVLPNQDINELY